MKQHRFGDKLGLAIWAASEAARINGLSNPCYPVAVIDGKEHSFDCDRIGIERDEEQGIGDITCLSTVKVHLRDVGYVRVYMRGQGVFTPDTWAVVNVRLPHIIGPIEIPL